MWFDSYFNIFVLQGFMMRCSLCTCVYIYVCIFKMRVGMYPWHIQVTELALEIQYSMVFHCLNSILDVMLQLYKCQFKIRVLHFFLIHTDAPCCTRKMKITLSEIRAPKQYCEWSSLVDKLECQLYPTLWSLYLIWQHFTKKQIFFAVSDFLCLLLEWFGVMMVWGYLFSPVSFHFPFCFVVFVIILVVLFYPLM